MSELADTCGSSPGLKSAFEERGYVILRNVLEPELLEGAQEALCGLVGLQARRLQGIEPASQEESSETFLSRPSPDRLDRLPLSFRRELHRPEMYDLFFASELLDLAEHFLGPEIRLYPNYTAHPKRPGWNNTQVLRYPDGEHTQRDTAGKGEALDRLNVWAPLVPAAADNNFMEFIPRTHRLERALLESPAHTHEKANPRQVLCLDRAVPIEAHPGDVVLFHDLILHRGPLNLPDAIRWGCNWQYGDATQPLRRREGGHLARSRSHPSRAVNTPEKWARLWWQ